MPTPAVIVALAAASTAQAEAPCELPTDLALQAEHAVVEGRFDDMEALVPRFEASLGCAPPIDPLTLAAFLRAEGAWFHLAGMEAEADMAFQSAARLAPREWTPAFGQQLRARFDSAADREAMVTGTLDLDPKPADPHLVVHIDGRPAQTPVALEAGIHAFQLVRSEASSGAVGEARFGRLVAVFPSEDILVNPGVLPVETALVSTPSPRDRPVWLLATAGGATLLSGLAAAVALNQPAVASEAQSIQAVNAAERRQRTMAFTSYGLLGAAAVAGAVYIAW